MFKNEYFAADYDGIQRSSVYNYIITFTFLEYIYINSKKFLTRYTCTYDNLHICIYSNTFLFFWIDILT